MAAQSGRELYFSNASTQLTGVQSKSVGFNADSVEITSDDDNGFQTFLPVAGKRGMALDASGVTVDRALIDIMDDPANDTFMLSGFEVTDEDGYVYSGNFYLESVSKSGTHDGAIEFSATIKSSGAWTKTAPTP